MYGLARDDYGNRFDTPHVFCTRRYWVFNLFYCPLTRALLLYVIRT